MFANKRKFVKGFELVIELHLYCKNELIFCNCVISKLAVVFIMIP